MPCRLEIGRSENPWDDFQGPIDWSDRLPESSRTGSRPSHSPPS
jgi:hypothetical protein